MDAFRIEEFNKYKVFLYDQLSHHADVDEAILIPFSQGTVHFLFYSAGEHKNFVHDVSDSHANYYIYVDTKKYDRFIDLLRHEKPLYLAVDHDKILAYITTELEPVGEGDFDMS